MYFYSLNQDDLKKAAEAEEYPNAADYIYLGIVHDTNAFQRADESIMKAATKLLELGVDHRRIIQTRQIDTLEDLEKRADILKKCDTCAGWKSRLRVYKQRRKG